MDKYLGTRLEGRYDILELIGKGGMANVYRAYDIIDDRTVAVKILRDEYMNNIDFLRRFKNESKAIAILNHPNIVKVHDVSFSELHFIIMEYIDGVTLKEYIEHKQVLPWKDAVHFSIQILHALQHAHDKGIVHRDIKPQNIMLLRNGQIKVTDFGIARFARSESRTISDRAIGSVHYISPEQAMGENTDEKSDIYSTGILLFEMITGQLPFEAESAVSVAIKQVQSPIKRPRSINPDIPPGLEEITLRAVQKDARMRYQSAAEMIDALEQFRHNPNIRFKYALSTNTGPISPLPVDPRGEKQQSRVEQELGDIGGENLSTVPQKKPRKVRQQKVAKKKNYYLRSMFLITLVIGLTTLVFMGIMVLLNNPFIDAEDTALPNFVGQEFAKLEGLYPNFDFVLKDTNYNDNFLQGRIYEQNPKAGSGVKVGSSVDIYLSAGIEKLEIEEYSGRPAASVLYEMRTKGLTIEEIRQNSDSIPAGRVIVTEPAVGAILSSGDKIVLYVSEGPERKAMSVPDVGGMNLKDASEVIKSAGFTVGSAVYQPHQLPAESVISQSPVAGSLEIQGSRVDMIVSEGGMESFYISVQLPLTMNREVSVRSRLGEDEVPVIYHDELINPATSPTGVWAPSFAGVPGETERIRIYIDGWLYMDYSLDYGTGELEILRDNRSSSHFMS